MVFPSACAALTFAGWLPLQWRTGLARSTWQPHAQTLPPCEQWCFKISTADHKLGEFVWPLPLCGCPCRWPGNCTKTGRRTRTLVHTLPSCMFSDTWGIRGGHIIVPGYLLYMWKGSTELIPKSLKNENVQECESRENMGRGFSSHATMQEYICMD